MWDSEPSEKGCCWGAPDGGRCGDRGKARSGSQESGVRGGQTQVTAGIASGVPTPDVAHNGRSRRQKLDTLLGFGSLHQRDLAPVLSKFTLAIKTISRKGICFNTYDSQ